MLIWQQLIVLSNILKLYRHGHLLVSYTGVRPIYCVVLWCHFFLYLWDYLLYVTTARICYRLYKAGGMVPDGSFLSVHTIMLQFCTHLRLSSPYNFSQTIKLLSFIINETFVIAMQNGGENFEENFTVNYSWFLIFL
jgi:hypothetical protein